MIRTPVFLFVLSSILAIAANPILAKRPNIILILTDDQDKESIGAYGGDVWTPNLDRMAKEGMLFHNGFVTSTVCTPSRYAFLTGRYPSRSSSEIFMEENPEGLNAEEVARQEIDKRKIEIAAEAQAERTRREAKGEADAILLKYEAESEGIRKVLDSKAAGYLALVQGCNGDAKAAATLLMTEKIEQIVNMQVEAIRNIKIDKVTVWDSGGEGSNGKTSTANFLSGMVKSLPPLHEVAGMAGIELPKYLGEIADKQVAEQAPQPKPAKTAAKPSKPRRPEPPADSPESA
jgi:hypothetical protein